MPSPRTPKTAHRIVLKHLVEKNPRITPRELAALFDITPARVRQLAAAEGVMLAGTKRAQAEFLVSDF